MACTLVTSNAMQVCSIDFRIAVPYTKRLPYGEQLAIVQFSTLLPNSNELAGALFLFLAITTVTAPFVVLRRHESIRLFHR